MSDSRAIAKNAETLRLPVHELSLPDQDDTLDRNGGLVDRVIARSPSALQV